MGPVGWGLLGDLNNDGVVNLLDYSWWARDFAKKGTGTYSPSAAPSQSPFSLDLDRDGVVGLGDIWLLVSDWLMEAGWR